MAEQKQIPNGTNGAPKGIAPKDIIIERFDSSGSARKVPQVSAEGLQKTGIEELREIQREITIKLGEMSDKYNLVYEEEMGKMQAEKKAALKNQLFAEVKHLSELLGKIDDKNFINSVYNNSSDLCEAANQVISTVTNLVECEQKELLYKNFKKEEEDIVAIVLRYISLCEKERSVQNPVEANNIQMEKYSCKNSAIRTRERVHQIINAFEDAMDLLAERRKEIVDTSINGEWPSLKNWENLTRSSLPGVGSMMISLSINMGSEKFGSFKNNMLSYTNPEHIEVCAREIIRTCNEAVSIVRERERRAKAQEENQKIQAEVQEEAYHVAKGFRSTGRQAAQAKNGRKVVAESVAVMGGAAALYGLVKDLPYVAAAGLTFTLLGADAARRSWKETGEFISGLISRGGFVTGLVATFTSGIACLIQHTQILSAYTADKTTNDIIVAAKFFFEYVSSVGEPLKLMIGGAIVTFAAPIIGAVIRAVTDSSDN